MIFHSSAFEHGSYFFMQAALFGHGKEAVIRINSACVDRIRVLAGAHYVFELF